MYDVRDDVFKRIKDRRVTANIYTDMDGVVAGMDRAQEEAANIGVEVLFSAENGDEVYAGDMIMQISGHPKEITMAEDRIIACLSKYSGVATAARAFVRAAGDKIRVVGGAWKKMPQEIKIQLRHAAAAGGAGIHMIDEPMLYLDKNYVAMFGGIQRTLIAVSGITDRRKIIQIKGRYEGGNIIREAETAISSGADIIYIDTGNIDDLRRVTEALKPWVVALEEQAGYRKIEFAFGGGVQLPDIPDVISAGADIVDIGRSIVDAPLIDLRLEVANVEEAEYAHADYDLMDKSELTIEGIMLQRTNLNELAEIIAEEIGVDPEDVLVIDVRDGKVSLDVLQSRLDPAKFVSKEETILRRIAQLDGVHLLDDPHITSHGMLGWIAGGDDTIEETREYIEMSRNLMKDIQSNVSRRVLVFPTGAEVEAGEIEDTNTPLIMSKFTEAGFSAEKGETLRDDLYLFSGKLRLAAERGYGVVITTGGVGAENKDYSVEAIELLDPSAAAPYIAKFKAGHGRHSKDGIRIGVGQMGFTTYIALPGPNDEVSKCIDTVVQGISEGWSKEILAARLAQILRENLRGKIAVHHASHNMEEPK